MSSKSFLSVVFLTLSLGGNITSPGQDIQSPKIQELKKKIEPLTEPPCSYCVDQNLKSLIKPDDPTLAWIRGAHNGGSFPLRHFISKYRVINDTYGLFFYDPDGGYVSAFEKSYGYRYYGRRNGVMIVQGKDGTLWSALSGKAVDGPQQGKTLKRIPSLTTTWSHWLLLHPESTAYDLFGGNKYPTVDLPSTISREAGDSLKQIDSRLEKFDPVIGVEGATARVAILLKDLPARAVVRTELEGKPIAMFWYGKTKSAVVLESEVNGQELTFFADQISPETAPFKDK